MKKSFLPRLSGIKQSEGKVWGYVFITSKEPRKVVRAVRKLNGVAEVDDLIGSPDAIAILEGRDMASVEAVIDKVAKVPGVLATDSKVARQIS